MRKEMKDEEGRYVCTVNSLMELSDGLHVHTGCCTLYTFTCVPNNALIIYAYHTITCTIVMVF